MSGEDGGGPRRGRAAAARRGQEGGPPHGRAAAARGGQEGGPRRGRAAAARGGQEGGPPHGRAAAARGGQEGGPPHGRAAGPVLDVEGLARHYGDREALSGVSLQLGEAQTLVVFGPNGAGKSTLLRILASLLRPHAGTVRVLGAELPRDGWRVRGRVGLLGHEPLLYRELSARENLRFHARLHGVAEARVQEVLEAVAMAGRADEPLRSLSRGMVQRVAVARAVLHDPPLLLLDEPHSHLDPAAVELVAPLIGSASGRTRVIASHDPGGGLAEADIVLGLRGGRPVLKARAAALEPEQIVELYR